MIEIRYAEVTFNFCEVSYKTSKVARYQIWDVKWVKDGQKRFLKNLEAKGAISIGTERPNIMNVMVEGTRAMQLEKLLKERDINYDVISTEIMSPSPKRVGSPKVHIARPKIAQSKLIDWKDYHPLHVVYNFMDGLEKQFPAKCTVNSLGTTAEGRDIKMLKISNSNASNTGVWIDAGIHAREWISVAVATFIADYLTRNFDNMPKNVTNKDWYIVPIVNPDGYVYTWTIDRMWRKNRAKVDNRTCGVDLNRNFGIGIGTNEGSSTDPNHNNFRGLEPFCEPETAAIKDLLLYSGTPFKVFITLHSYSEVISFPWCHTADSCPDYVTLLEGGTIMSKAMFETTGRVYKVGAFKDLMYHASGTSIDWSYGVAHIPFSYLLELRSKQHRFILPKEEIGDCCKETLSAILALSEYVDRHECKNCTMFTKR